MYVHTYMNKNIFLHQEITMNNHLENKYALIRIAYRSILCVMMHARDILEKNMRNVLDSLFQ